MPEIIYGVHFITEADLDELKRLFEAEALPGTILAEFEVPNVIVIRHVHINDPFDVRFKSTFKTSWILTPAELYSKFTIRDDANRTLTFALLDPK